MGLERVAAVMQRKLSSWETDLFAPLVARIGELSGKHPGASEDDDVSLRVIADHGRTATFLIADGVTPSNEWRGYVLRRIMRRAMRHGRMLGLTEPFLWKTVAWVGDLMGAAYPEIVTERGRVEDAVRGEEERFAETLDSGMRRIEEYLALHGEGASRAVDGGFLFTLYDTYGFPRDLAEDVLKEHGWVVTDETSATWDLEMEAQRDRARAGAAFSAGDESESAAVYQRLSGELPPVEFVGYETLTAPARILAMVRGTQRVREAAAGDEVEVILDRTPDSA